MYVNYIDNYVGNMIFLKLHPILSHVNVSSGIVNDIVIPIVNCTVN